MKKIKEILNNEYIFSMVAKIFTIFSGIIYSIVYSRYLGAELRGTASVISNYAEMISLIMCLGIYQAYPFFRKKNKDIYMEYINYVFGLFNLYLIFIIIIVFVFKLEFNMMIAILLAPLYMGIKQLNYVVLIENPKVRNSANIKLDLFDIVFLLVLMIFTTANLKWCIIFLVVKQLVFFVIAITNLHINVFKIRPTLKGIMPYIKYGIIPMITVILMEVNYKIDILMLEKMNISMSEIGIYSLGVMLAQKLWMLPDALKDILLSKLVKGKDKSEVAKVTRITLAVTILLILGMSIFGKLLIKLMYGEEYINAYGVTIIILAGILGMVFYKMIYSYNVAIGKKNVNFVILLIAAMINIILNLGLIPKIEIYGAAIASLISYLLCGICFLIYFCKNTSTAIIDMILIKKSDIRAIYSKIMNKN